MARASRVYSLSICNSGVGRGRRKPSGSRSPSRYPHWRKALKTRSRSGLEPLVDAGRGGSVSLWFLSMSAALVVPVFGVAIGRDTRIKDAGRSVQDSGRADRPLDL